MLLYKVIETSIVTDEELERLINDWVPKGWHFDGIHFAMRETSKRPAMAFLLFTRGESEVDTDNQQREIRSRNDPAGGKPGPSCPA